jgi:hypothetical protein
MIFTASVRNILDTSKYYHITRGNKHERLYNAPKGYRKWSHPAEAIKRREKGERNEYKIEIYVDGGKSAN